MSSEKRHSSFILRFFIHGNPPLFHTFFLFEYLFFFSGSSPQAPASDGIVPALLALRRVSRTPVSGPDISVCATRKTLVDGIGTKSI